MDWTAAVDGYCERTDPSLWSEPVNALTNLAFLIAAVAMWRPAAGLPVARLLCVVLFAIGIGSGLFHTQATLRASLADTLPIAVFILVYVYAANRHYWGLSPVVSTLGSAAAIPWVAVFAPLFARLPGFAASAVYWPVPLLIALYAAALWTRAPATAKGLAAGAGLLGLSLVARSLDAPLCGAVPLGTHWIWHILNALMLGWMILVLLRHRRQHLAGGEAGG